VSSKRRRPSPARRLRPFWILIGFVVVVLIAGGLFAASWSGFAPKYVIVSGNAMTSRAEILNSAQISGTRSMWLQNPSSIAARIERLPFIANARVYRVPPATMVVSVSERKPYAIVRSGRSEAIVDRDLRVLQAPPPADSPLPIFVLSEATDLTPGAFVKGRDALALRDDYHAMLAAHVVPARLSIDRFGGIVATMRDGVSVLFGDDDDLAKKLPLVNPIFAQVVRSSRRISAIDLRAPSTPVVVYRR
jgi:cell division protein FtsQ